MAQTKVSWNALTVEAMDAVSALRLKRCGTRDEIHAALVAGSDELVQVIADCPAYYGHLAKVRLAYVVLSQAGYLDSLA